MQSAVPKGEGGMLAVLGTEVDKINEILNLNKDNFKCFVAFESNGGQQSDKSVIFHRRYLPAFC